jgi:hypothetical protein
MYLHQVEKIAVPGVSLEVAHLGGRYRLKEAIRGQTLQNDHWSAHV